MRGLNGKERIQTTEKGRIQTTNELKMIKVILIFKKL